MEQTVHVKVASSDHDLNLVYKLFEEYAESLPIDLDYQDFVSELEGLPGKYSDPRGALLLALDQNGSPLGCVGLRPLDDIGCCEMKRLYTLPSARGLGIGRTLTLAIIGEAKRKGYHTLHLDTLPTMSSAIALYEKLGFNVIEPYYGPTPSGTVFMAIAL